jgi:hypothetical protein
MGFYPSGSQLFTAMLHYVRSGDFVEHLLTEAANIREYAFALGVLCHYNADRYGHPIGINTSVPLIYPKMQRRHGDTVTWAEDNISHIRTEFSFDVLQTARGAYASAAYQDFIGFKIADTVLRKAFTKTYGLSIDDLFKDLARTIAIFRWTVTNLFPFITRAAWVRKKDQIRDSIPGATARSFVYRMKVKNYNKQFEKRDRPGFTAYVVAQLLRILPKIGPLRPLKFRQPTLEAEKKFIESFEASSTQYAALINLLDDETVQLANIDFDTGEKTAAGEYGPADEAYHDWLLKLERQNFAGITPAMRSSLLSFYASYKPETETRKQRKKWAQLKAAIDRLAVS